jgi:hypothetical protein
MNYEIIVFLTWAYSTYFRHDTNKFLYIVPKMTGNTKPSGAKVSMYKTVFWQ